MQRLYKKGTLPCLQSVDENWSAEDRLLLFYYLKRIFGIEYDYFATLPCCHFQSVEGNEDQVLDVDAMSKFDASIVGESKRITCMKIKRGAFSFGGMNERVCYLCPYSGTYKNENENYEKEVLYYQHGFYSLSSYLEREGVKLEKVIKSHYPVYQNGILKDALPLLSIANLFLYEQLPLVKYVDNKQEVDDQNLKSIEEIISRQFAAKMRKKPYYITDPQGYKKAMVESAKSVYLEVVRLEESPIAYVRQIKLLEDLDFIDEGAFKRLVKRLAVQRDRYKPCAFEEYREVIYSPIKEIRMPSFVVENYPEKNPGAVEADQQIQEEVQPVTEADDVGNDLQCNAQDIEAIRENDIIDDTLPVSDDFDSLQNLDDKLFDLDDLTRIANECEEGSSESDSPVSDDGDEEKFVEKEEDTFLKNVLDDVPWLNSVNEDLENVFSILADDVDVSVEPASKDGIVGLLLVGSEIAVFYPADLYGGKYFIKLMKNRCRLYTTHLFEVASYLHRNKIYSESVHDVNIAAHYSPTAGETMDGEMPDLMRMYPKMYERLLEAADIRDQVILHERFCSIITSDGMIPPFRNLKTLYKKADGIAYESQFGKSNVPSKSGSFYLLNIKLEGSEVCTENTYQMICVELDKYLNFSEGRNYVLGLDQRGILLYVTGSEMDREDAGSYLKACSRRVIKDKYGVRSKYEIKILHQYVVV